MSSKKAKTEAPSKSSGLITAFFKPPPLLLLVVVPLDGSRVVAPPLLNESRWIGGLVECCDSSDDENEECSPKAPVRRINWSRGKVELYDTAI